LVIETADFKNKEFYLDRRNYILILAEEITSSFMGRLCKWRYMWMESNIKTFSHWKTWQNL